MLKYHVDQFIPAEKFKMSVTDKLEPIKVDYFTTLINLKLNKDKEITWDYVTPVDYKKIIEDKIKQLEKGKYTLNYRIGILNGEVVDKEIEPINQ